jgi:hypothetical protein
MLIDNMKTFYPTDYIKVREDKRGDWSEISVYVERASPYKPSVCAAVITHPCTNAKWFVHDRDTGIRGIPFKTRKLAMYAAIEAAKDTEAYKEHFI